MKLYNGEEISTSVEALEKLVDSRELDLVELDRDLISLEKAVSSYSSLDIIASESVDWVRDSVLFNEYVRVVGEGFGLKVPSVSLEDIGKTGGELRQELALEGFVGDMWEKVKTLFKKIYESIKSFFAKHFTKLGRVKKKLSNLQSVLKSTDTDITVASSDKVPSSLVSKFGYSGRVNVGVVNESLDTASAVLDVLEVTNTKAKVLASKDVMSRDFVAKIKTYREDIEKIKKDTEANKGELVGGLKGIVNSDARAKNKEIKETNASLAAIAKDKEKEIDNSKDKVDTVVRTNKDIDFEDSTFTAAKKELEDYLGELGKALEKLKGKSIPGSKVVEEISVDIEKGIEITMGTLDKGNPDSVTLGSKADLSKLVDRALDLIESMEDITGKYSVVNDTVIKNLDTVDGLIKDLDKTPNDVDPSYKKILQVKVRERLKLMQTFFTNYNKVNKNFMGIVLDCGEGVVSYSVESLKFFGKGE